MVELTQTVLEQKLANEMEPFAVFVHTPMCGTCKLAERMLSIVMDMIPTLPLFRMNINQHPTLAQSWQISSVPALIIFRDRVVAEKHYALRSVDFLYRILKSLQ